MQIEEEIKASYERIVPFLDERTKRLYIANEALRIGRGGKMLVSKALGVGRVRINEGIKELEYKSEHVASSGKIRRSGGGRRPISESYPDLRTKLEEIVSPHTRGDPENPLCWCSKSLRKIQQSLKDNHITVSHVTIEKMLQTMGYSLQSNRKTDEGSSEEDRDMQFCNINQKSKEFMENNQPVISVDCKKKELIGNYKNSGKEWEKSKSPQEVKVYDFIDPQLGKASPYGIYDIAHNQGWVNVGISSDTAQFAVNTIRTWWQQMGKETYPKASKLLITADSGGSNSAASKLWKKELQIFASETGLEIHVCHFPPGTSKWNKIEHRLFSYISKNWRGKPLISLELIIQLIANTTTEKGLIVRAIKDETIYQKGINVTNEEMEAINLKRDDFRGKWNYNISP
ncbi:MAG: ISAzo13 family transposase [Dysgonamonadaceae bacterium]|nr:ISAzo13 family transposase [Dysgonamonadaceae bacterium]